MSRMKAAIIPVTPFQQNCTLLWVEPTMRGVVIDPGGDVESILEAIDKTKVTVERIFITHGHIDHAGGAADLKERLGVPIDGPNRADAFLLEQLVEQGEVYGLEGARNVEPDRWLNDGEHVTVGDHVFDVLHCPGHSPGSVVYVARDLKLAIVGDVLFAGSIGRTDLPGGDYDTLIRSIRDKLLPLGDDVTFISGHGPASTIGQERATNPFLREA